MDSRFHEDLERLRLEHGLWRPDAAVRTLAEGDENRTIEVGDYIVRFSVNADGDGALHREGALLRVLARQTAVPVPEPVVSDADASVLIYRRLPGTPLLGRDAGRPDLVADGLIDLLSAVRRLGDELQLPDDDYDDDAWRDDAAADFEIVRHRLAAEQADVIAAFLHAPPPPPRSRMVASHNDLGAEHLLVDDRGKLSGVIDWTDAAMADATRDLGSIFRDLGPELAFRVAAGLDDTLTDDDARRIAFHARCRWIEDLRYGLDDPSRRSAYLENAWRTFARTFSDGRPAAKPGPDGR